jgi:hypothetical protein
MAKSHRLYISFHTDDNIKGKNHPGWVDEFIKVLEIFLNRVNGESPEIVAIDKSSKVTELVDGDGIVLITSENYIKDKSYQGVLPLLKDLEKVFKLDLSPINKAGLPKELRGLNEFQFFTTENLKNKSFVTLNGRKTAQAFGLKVIDLAFDISRVLYKKSQEVEGKEVRSVFLAETSYDQIANRDDVKRELLRHGFEVLPKVPFSSDLGEFEKQVKKCLEKADLTVQIIGEQYGEVLEGSNKSVIEMQNELATDYYTKSLSEVEHSLHRLIWMPLFLRPSSDQQKLYLDKLRDDISSTSGAEIIQTPLEILKTIIHTRLQLFERDKLAIKKRVQEKSDKKYVYLLFDQKDASYVEVLKSEITNRNLSVIVPDFSVKQVDLLQQHRESLIKSDGVLLYANRNLNWLNSKLNDVIKAPGFGKPSAFEAKAVLIKDASISKDEIANFGDLIMLNGDKKGEKTTDLSPFIDKIALL